MEHSDKHLHLVWKLEAIEIAHTSPGTSWVKQQKKLHRRQLSVCLNLNPLGGQKTAFFLFYYVRCPSLLYQLKKLNFFLKHAAVNKTLPTVFPALYAWEINKLHRR